MDDSPVEAPDMFSLAGDMAAPLVVHVVDHDHQRRAQVARCAFAIGHHAEIYSGIEELAAVAPTKGVVIALEDVAQGGFGQLLSLLNREGRWMAVVATSTEPTVEKAVAAVRQGAVDYLTFPIEPDILARTIANVVDEAGSLSERARRRHDARERLARITPREREVLASMATGLTNKEIGSILGISPRTVEIHRNSLLTKLAARNSVDGLRIWFEAEPDVHDVPTKLS